MLPFGKPRTTDATTVPGLLLFFCYDANDNLIFQKTSSICTQPLLVRQPQTLEVFVTEVCPAGEDSNLYMPFIQAPRTTNATTVPGLLPRLLMQIYLRFSQWN